jgi:transposase
MLYIGLDTHKPFSYCTILNENGQVIFSQKIPHDERVYKKLFLEGFKEEKIATVEGGYNWGVVYELLTSIGIKTKVGNPLKIKSIASAKIKTDKRDSETLAYLLKANLIPEIYISPKETRELKYVLRERASIAREITRTKNKIHNLLTRNKVYLEQSDIFGKKGREFIDKLKLEKHSAFNLKHNLNNLDEKAKEIKEYNKYLKGYVGKEENYKLLKTIPGIGDILASLIALEISDIKRFPDAQHFASYCGLIPSIYSTNKTRRMGHLIRGCNKHLKTALVEASWVAIRYSPYFGYYFNKLRYKKSKHKNVAIAGVARKMAEIIYNMLKEKRPYEERVPKSLYEFQK